MQRFIVSGPSAGWNPN